MIHCKIRVCVVVPLIIIAHHLQAQPRVLPLITPRPSSTNLARELIETYAPIFGQSRGCIFVVPEFIKSFHPEDIADTLFGPLVCPSPPQDPHCTKQECNVQRRTCRRSFIVSGSQVASRNSTDWLADYCGLPPDFQSIVSIQPQYISTLADIGAYISLDPCIPHGYIFIHAPLEYSRWNLRLQESIVNTGTLSYQAGYFDTTTVNRSALVSSFSAFAQGTEVPQLKNSTFEPLACAKISPCAHTISGISDAQIIIGGYPLDTHDYTCGVAARISIPGGHSPKARYLFEPLIGATDHYKLGLEVTGHFSLWRNRHTNESCSFDAALIINHLFGTFQQRTFDLCGSPLSRYMLAQKVDTVNEDNLQAFIDGNFVKPAYIFANVFEPVANLTTAKIRSRMSIECEFSCMFSFNRDHFSWHIGYNFWVQSREHITINCCRLDNETWALKGNAQVFGFLAEADGTLPQNNPVALSATQSHATITHGTNASVAGSLLAVQNPGIDGPAPASAGASNTRLLYAPGLPNVNTNQINTSVTPILLTCDQLDIEGARIAHKANKLFMHMQYTIANHTRCTQTLGLGAEVDFGTHSDDPLTYTCSFWGLWAYVGAQF